MSEHNGNGVAPGQHMVRAEDLPRPITTYPAAIFEIVPDTEGEGSGITMVIHSRNEVKGFPMNLEYAEKLVGRMAEAVKIAKEKESGLQIVENRIDLPPGVRPSE